LRLYRRDHPTHSRQELPARALLRVVFQQDARPAGQAGGRRSADRGELIKKVWEADPLRCPKCSGQMRIVSLIDQEDFIERILRHLGLWQEGGARAFRHRPAGRNDPRSVARRPLPRLRHRTGHGVLRHLKRPAAPECASRTPCSAAPPSPRAPCLTSGPIFVTLRPWKRTLSASDSGSTPRRTKSDFLSVRLEEA
jgi:hypothetical protein